MAVGGGNVHDITRSADADYSAKQYYLMAQKNDGDAVLASAATNKLIGVLQNKPAAAGRAAVVRVSGLSKCLAGGTIDEGDWITADSNGKGVATTTDKNVVIGVAMSPASSGEYFMLLVSGPFTVDTA